MQHEHSQGYIDNSGKVVITYAAPPCPACEQDNRVFEALQKDRGMHWLEKRLSKLPSYRAYAQRWPYDLHQQFLSYDMLQESGLEQAGLTDLEAEYMADEAVREFKATLTELQLEMVAKYEQGFKTREIYRDYGYKNTGGLRYHKFIMRRKHRQLVSPGAGDVSAELFDVVD